MLDNLGVVTLQVVNLKEWDMITYNVERDICRVLMIHYMRGIYGTIHKDNQVGLEAL